MVTELSLSCEPHLAQPCACGAVLWQDRSKPGFVDPEIDRARREIPVWVDDPGGHG